MKTPFDDLEFKLEYNKIEEGFFGKSIHVICKLIHKDLPLEFSIKFECTEKLEKSKQGYVKEQINRLINKLYKEVYTCSILGKSCKPFVFNMNHKIYTGEWDREKEAWFVLDSFGDKCYTAKDVKGQMSDELNTY